MIPGIDEIKSLAVKYSKKQLAHMAQMGLVDPQKAVMAGMMRDRISQEDMKPPTSTVAQDVLGLPAAQPQPQMQPQMGMQQPQQAPQAPQAPAGVEALPAGNVGSYAGGGIVAFADGGDTAYDPMTGLPLFGGAAQDDYSLAERFGMLFDSGYKPYRPPVRPEVRAKQEQDKFPAKQWAEVAADLKKQEEKGKVKDKRAATTREPQFPGGLDTRPAAGAPAAPAFSLPKFDPSGIKISGAELPIPEQRARQDISAARRAAEVEEGVDPEMYANMLRGIEEKKGKLEGRKDEAKGAALMQLGLGLMGARRGQEFQTLGTAGAAALSAYRQDVKDLQTASEKYDERMEALRISDQQAKQTGARADVAQAEKDREAFNAAKIEQAKAKNELARTEAQVAANVYGTQTQAATSMATAQLSAQTQKEIANLNASVQKWIYSRPPTEIQAIEAVAARTGKPFAQAMNDFYAARQAPKQALTREDALKIVKDTMPMATPEQLNAAADRLIAGAGGAKTASGATVSGW